METIFKVKKDKYKYKKTHFFMVGSQQSGISTTLETVSRGHHLHHPLGQPGS